MGRLAGLLDRIPAAYEHAAVIFGSVFAYTVCAAVVTARRAAVLWESGQVWTSALDAAAVAAAGLLLLTFTPLTRRYGVGSGQPAPDTGDQDA